MSLLDRPVLFANFLSSDEVFSGKLTERTERITHLLYYDTLHLTWFSRMNLNGLPDCVGYANIIFGRFFGRFEG
jgi:hypothetical protein